MKTFTPVFSALAVLLLVLLTTPIVNMVISSPPALLRSTLLDQEVLHAIILTLKTALWATLSGFLLGIPLAYILARWSFPGKSFLQGLVDLPIMIPHTAMGVALLMVYGKKFLIGSLFSKIGISFVGTEVGISLAMAYVSLPFLVNAARDGFLAVNPRLEAVARTLGASPWQTFFKVTLPLARRAILTGAIMMWARGISEFGAVVILAYHPMVAPILIWERFESYGLAYARPVASLLIIICLLIFAVLRWLSGRSREV
ncbi:MAG: molybdenum ABC transporter permease [Desulfobulbus sp.]|nr:MAG: molybdenum ABC transporter permease [Desulfobulbus sp.]